MPEEGRWCGDARKVITFFLEIDLDTIGPWHNCQRTMWPPESHEFDTSGLTNHQRIDDESLSAVRSCAKLKILLTVDRSPPCLVMFKTKPLTFCKMLHKKQD